MALSSYADELLQYNTFRRPYVESLSDRQWGQHCLSCIQENQEELLWIWLYLEWTALHDGSGRVDHDAMEWLRRFPHSVKLVVDVSRYWLRAGKVEQAEPLLRAYLKQFDNEGMLWCVLGEVQFSKGYFHSALECAERVLTAQPEHAEALRLQAKVAMQSGDTQQSARSLEASLRADPSNIESLIMRGMLHHAQENPQMTARPWNAVARALRLMGYRLSTWQGGFWCTVILSFWLSIGAVKGSLNWATVATGLQIYTACCMLGWSLTILGHVVDAGLGRRDWRWNPREHWPIIPLMVWLALTSIRYCTGDSEWSFGLDLARSLAFCCFVPLLAMSTSTLLRLSSWSMACTLVCFGVALICALPACYLLAFILTGLFAISYMWRKQIWSRS